jgi:hypothetical protein
VTAKAVAALRSGGLGVSRHGRAEAVADSAAMARAVNQAVEHGSGNAVMLFAEDVHRGFRVDVAPVKDEVEPGPVAYAVRAGGRLSPCRVRRSD